MVKKAGNRNPQHSVVAELDAICRKQGISFESAVRDYYVQIQDPNGIENKESSFCETFKKYRQRAGASLGKPVCELQKLRDFLLRKETFYPQPLLDLVQGDPVCERAKEIFGAIWEQVNSSDS